jgi:hypothetical protein
MPVGNNASRVMITFSLGGFVSGLLTGCLTHGRSDNAIIPGLLFGLILAGCLSLAGIFSSIGQSLLLIVVALVAYSCSVFSAIGLQMSFPQIVPPSEQWSMSTAEPASPIALLVGGAVGGFIIFGGMFLLAAPRTGMTGIVSKALQGSVLGGVLGVAGWAFRSTVGVTIWHLFHSLRMTNPWELTPRTWFGGEYNYSETTRMYSLFVVWQTCVAIAIGFMLRNYTSESRAKNARR